jgi:hypothetical protein
VHAAAAAAAAQNAALWVRLRGAAAGQSAGTLLGSMGLPCLGHLDVCISAPCLTAAAEAVADGLTCGTVSAAADLLVLPPLLLPEVCASRQSLEPAGTCSK